jgi:hypothetical protein
MRGEPIQFSNKFPALGFLFFFLIHGTTLICQTRRPDGSFGNLHMPTFARQPSNPRASLV